MRRTTTSILLLITLAGVGCGSAEDVLTSPSSVTQPSSASTSADATTTTADPTPSLSTTEQAPTSTVSVTDATDTTVPAAPPRAMFAVVASDLVELDPLTGNVARVVVPQFSGDGRYREQLRQSPDGNRLYFTEGTEDSWYSCDTSRGSVGSVDVASGVFEELGFGGGISVAPDGGSIAWIDSSLCLPDPRAPDREVLTPGNRIVVQDLATGSRAEIVDEFEIAPDATQFPESFWWVGFDPDGHLFVVTIGGGLYRADLATMSIEDDAGVQLPSAGRPIGISNGHLLMYGDVTQTSVIAIELSTGSPSVWWESSATVHASIRFDGRVFIADRGATESSTNEHVTVIALPEAEGLAA